MSAAHLGQALDCTKVRGLARLLLIEVANRCDENGELWAHVDLVTEWAGITLDEAFLAISACTRARVLTVAYRIPGPDVFRLVLP